MYLPQPIPAWRKKREQTTQIFIAAHRVSIRCKRQENRGYPLPKKQKWQNKLGNGQETFFSCGGSRNLTFLVKTHIHFICWYGIFDHLSISLEYSRKNQIWIGMDYLACKTFNYTWIQIHDLNFCMILLELANGRSSQVSNRRCVQCPINRCCIFWSCCRWKAAATLLTGWQNQTSASHLLSAPDSSFQKMPSNVLEYPTTGNIDSA